MSDESKAESALPKASDVLGAVTTDDSKSNEAQAAFQHDVTPGFHPAVTRVLG
jgi:hypothetical protein